MLVSNPRYKFYKVFGVVASIQVFFILFGIFSTYIFSELAKDADKLVNESYFIRQGMYMVMNTFLYFITLNLFNSYFVKRARLRNYVQLSLAAFIFCLGAHAIVDFVAPVQGMQQHLKLVGMIYSYSIFSIFAIGLSLLIAYLNNLRDEKKQRKILEAQKMQLEVEKSQANLNFLKAQINPHFLHNTLNYLYSKSLPLSEELSEGILTLSDIMRYALSDGNTVDGKSLLKEEIEHVQNVIRINQLRFSNKLNVDLTISGNINGARIIPFVLITLVENAFKHGDLKSVNDPILIRIKVENGVLHFLCRNKKKSGPKEISTGLGLDNISKRLELAYGNKHTFKITDEENYYTTELTLNSL